MNGFLNAAKNKYSVNKAVDVERIDRLMPLAILFKTNKIFDTYQHNRVKEFCKFYSGEKL